MKEEIFKADNPDEIVWLRLNRLKSINLCKNLIRAKLEKNPNATISNDILKSKSTGLSSAIESAIGYWQHNAQSLNAKVLSRYYFLLQMTIAEQVSSIKSTDTLKEVQKHTENGHGLGTITDSTKDFPNNYFSFALRSGHFYSYAKHLDLNPKNYDFEKRPRKFSDIMEKDKLINLVDLFRRIPELRNVIEEYTDEPPLSFHIGYDNENNLSFAERPRKLHPELIKSTIGIYSDSKKVTPQYLESLNLPFTEYKATLDAQSNTKYIIAQREHLSNFHWWQNLSIYTSSHCPNTIMVPLWNEINDIVVINFILLYTLSIIVRYLPDLWYRINYGDLNHIRSLIEYYISVIDHVLPLEMLQRITETKISIHQPGSFMGQI